MSLRAGGPSVPSAAAGFGGFRAGGGDLPGRRLYGRSQLFEGRLLRVRRVYPILQANHHQVGLFGGVAATEPTGHSHHAVGAAPAVRAFVVPAAMAMGDGRRGAQGQDHGGAGEDFSISCHGVLHIVARRVRTRPRGGVRHRGLVPGEPERAASTLERSERGNPSQNFWRMRRSCWGGVRRPWPFRAGGTSGSCRSRFSGGR